MSSLSPHSLHSAELVVVTGKGGVGKTTVAAALALVLARERKVTLLEVDPRESAHRLFDVPPSGGEPVPVAKGLELLHTRPRQVVDEIVSSKLKVGPLVRRLQASPIYDHFVDGAPGLKELALLRFAHDLVRGSKGKRRTDCVVLDSPATGHALSLLSAPGLAAEAIASGPIAALAGEVAGWLEADSTGFVLVTLAEELPVTETLEAAAALETLLGKPAAAWVANALYPVVPPGYRGSPGSGNPDSVSELWLQRRAVNDRELARLGRSVGRGLAALPLLPIGEGRALVEALAERLAPALADAIGGGSGR